MLVPYTWLTEFVKLSISPKELSDVLTLGGLEVEQMSQEGDETIYSLGIGANRPDCLSIIGVAREVSALTNSPFITPNNKVEKGKGKITDLLKVNVIDCDGCKRYMSRVIRGVKVAQSSDWLIKKLELSGIRAVNNVVDLTNYVMLETGQPLHAFDRRHIKSDIIRVMNANDGEKFITLDGEERTISSRDLLIADGVSAIALAGIMGGKNSEVRDDTTDLVLESAYFNPTRISKSSKRLCISSESSRRFERGVDPNGVETALHRLSSLIVELCGGTPTADWIDHYPTPIEPWTVELTVNRTNSLLGSNFKEDEVSAALIALKLKLLTNKKGWMRFEIPTFRGDLQRDVDLIEEVARVKGYHNIPETMPTIEIRTPHLPDHIMIISNIRRMLQGLGLCEAKALSFTSREKLRQLGRIENAVSLTNPFSDDDEVLTTTLIAPLLDALKLNISRQSKDVMLYAVQAVFVGDLEKLMLSGIAHGLRYPKDWETKIQFDFYDLKKIIESIISGLGLDDRFTTSNEALPSCLHPGEGARLSVNGEDVGFFGLLHPGLSSYWDIPGKAYAFELDIKKIIEISNNFRPKFFELSKFPFVERDLSILVKEDIALEMIYAVVDGLSIEILKKYRLFDYYKGKGLPEGNKSLAIRFRFEGENRTLKDEEVDEAIKIIIDKLKENLGVSLRS